jgi:Asp-tRNA(Asn)/Glu-tRNA(Gln) amidotransferase A subunit family amidase
MTTTTNEFSVEDFLQQGHDGKCPLRRSTSKKPTTENFRYWSIADYLACYKLKELTPLQVAKAILQAIDASEKRKIPLRAFLQINRPQLLQEAKESTKRYQENQLKGPLDGIPVAIKDEMLVKEHALTFGTNFYGQKVVNFSTVDATAVQRLRDAGTMIIGTTNMFELGTGTSGFNLHHGTPRNPYDPETYTGGSSSGSAVAVASGLVPLALGVDGGGSVRIPSTLCGIVGLKATFQRIPSISEGAPSVSNIGPMASNVKDTAIGYAILSGPHEAYPRSFMQPNIHFQDFEATQDLKGIRIGIFSEYVNDSAPIVRETFWQSVEFLKKRGAIIKETQLHHLNAIHRAHLVTITTELSFFMDKFYTDHLKDHAAEVQLVFSFGRALSAMDFLAAQKIRQFALRQLKEQVFNQVDVFMTPGVAVTSPKIPSDALSFGETDAKLISAFMKYVVLGNLVGIPGIVVPVGYSHGGEGQKGQLPIGVQFQSLHWQEDVIFRLANTIEKEFTTKKRPFPQVFYDILTTSQSF